MNYKKITFILCLGIFLSAGRSANAQSDTTFNYTGAIQTWVVPPCVFSVTYDVAGAQGGTNGSAGGLGARMQGVVAVTPGNTLSIYVGGQGGVTYEAASGGGGSGIVHVATPLVVAGGGGGASLIDGYAGHVGLTGTTGGSSSGPGGTGGNGGDKGYTPGDCGWAAGGGGFSGDGYGGNGPGDGGSLPGTLSGIGAGKSALNGGAGGTDGSCNGGGAAGGWGCGGGGSGNYGAGGGGGYSGGGGGQYTPNQSLSPGGGGGSYTIGTDTVNTSGYQSGNGYVTMSWVPSHVSLSDTAVVVKNANCHGNSTGVASASEPGVGVKYLWTPSGQTTDTAKGLSAGSYTLAISDACGDTVRGSVTITQPNILSGATAVATQNILCHGGSDGAAKVSSIAGGGSPFTYSWSDANLQTTVAATGLSAGSYTVTVTDVCNETTTTTVTITQPIALSVAANVTTNVSCNGQNDGSASSTVSNGSVPYTYAWSNAQVTSSATGLVAGSYTLIVTDNNGCSGSARVTITQPLVLTLSAATTSNIACNGSNTGQASSTLGGGTSPYNYTWTGGGGNVANPTTLAAGIDTVVVVDAHGCSASASTLVTEPAALNLVRESTVDHGGCIGSAWVVVGGGNAPYTYAWSNNANTTYYISGLCAGSYCCTVTDHSGCSDSVCITVTSDLGVGNINGNTAQITVYPNPNSGQFTIESAVTNKASSVEIYNVLGEKVYSTSIAANKGGATTINISNQPNGIYLYRVISNDNGSLLGQGKVILQK